MIWEEGFLSTVIVLKIFDLSTFIGIKEVKVEVGIGGGKITATTLIFRRSSAFCGENQEDSQIQFDKAGKILENYGMKLNKTKTKGMSCSKSDKKKWLNKNCYRKLVERVLQNRKLRNNAKYCTRKKCFSK